MCEETLIRCCAPTLAGIKTGSIFSFSYSSLREMGMDLRALNALLRSRGLRLFPLRYSEGRALLYLFRPEKLRRDLCSACAEELLREAGYEGLRLGQCLRRLCLRLREGADFPHEIGLFLSYPPEDVRGFIENQARNYKCLGYWKVYGDELKARQIFEQYRICTDTYCKSLRAGRGLAQLAVAI